MPITAGEFLDAMERLTPGSLAEDWDNIGLQVGSSLNRSSSVLVTLNVTGEVLDEAAYQKCGIILTHHPLIFQPMAAVSDDTATGRLILRASREDIAIIVAHTNLDAAKGGLADTMAELIDLRRVTPLQGAMAGLSKLVVFVPPADLEPVRESLFAAGAGAIGDYSHCSWYSEGTGTFLPLEGAHPAKGKVGSDEQTPEIRLELVFPSQKIDEVVRALKAAHSYEEPAYDIYPLETRHHNAGSGRIGELPAEVSLSDFASMLAEIFSMRGARFVGDPEMPVRNVALVPGSGAGYISLAAGRADVLVTGDFKYHDAALGAELGLGLVNLPHDISERTALAAWLPRLEREMQPRGVSVLLSSVPTGYWQAAPALKKTQLTDQEEKSMHHLHVDGGSRGNPGPAGIGAVLADPDGEPVETLASYIGEATNNVAEYQAMISGLELALDRGVTRLAIFSDSELIVRQLEGAYRVKNEGLRPYYQQAKSLLSRLEEYEISSIPREANAHADELVNQALDESGH
ncbi:MAG: Nif3-like dinuclear metal center hexameric protein [Thermoleophilia bacterium]|nr:Nif3-like dinuclear metal center hexameric protein [Thermoleophilia bacterium]